MMSGFEYVFQNYIYVPIISAIIGAIFSIFTPKIAEKIIKEVKKKINKSTGGGADVFLD